MVSDWTRSTVGIAPGSASAVCVSKLALFPLVTEILVSPNTTGLLHMDDTVLGTAGANEEQVAREALELEGRAKKHLAEIGMEVSDEKEQVMATSHNLGKHLLSHGWQRPQQANQRRCQLWHRRPACHRQALQSMGHQER